MDRFRAPMSRAVIGGLVTSTILTLVVVPVAYTSTLGSGKGAPTTSPKADRQPSPAFEPVPAASEGQNQSCK